MCRINFGPSVNRFEFICYQEGKSQMASFCMFGTQTNEIFWYDKKLSKLNCILYLFYSTVLQDKYILLPKQHMGEIAYIHFPPISSWFFQHQLHVHFKILILFCLSFHFISCLCPPNIIFTMDIHTNFIHQNFTSFCNLDLRT